MQGFHISWEVVFSRGVVVAMLVSAVLICFLMFLGVRQAWPLRATRRARILKILRRGVTMFLVLSIAVACANVALAALRSFIGSLAGSQRMQLEVALCVVVLGLCAFVFRLNRQFWYGLVEVAFAFVYAYVAMAKSDVQHPDPLPTMTALLGATYIAVRGLSNMVEAEFGKVASLTNLLVKILERLDRPRSTVASTASEDRHV